MIRTLQFFLVRAWLPLALVLAWQALSATGVFSPLVLPAPTVILQSVIDLTRDGQIFRHIGMSLLRVGEGFGLAAVAGVALGAAIGLWPIVSKSTTWLIETLRPIPPIGWFPLAILWFGIGEPSKMYIIFLGAFFPILANVVDGIRQTDARYVEVARVHEVGWGRLLWKVIIPGALPSTMTGLRVGLGLAWTCVVAAELIAAESGVGYLIVDARQTSRPDVVIVGMLVIGLLGILMDAALRRLEVRLIPWKRPFAGSI